MLSLRKSRSEQRAASAWAVTAGLVLAMLVVFGCGGPGIVAPQLPVFGQRDSTFTDAQLLQAAYSDYQVPAGFYHEPPSDLPFYYVNTGSARDSYHRPSLPWTELATEDVNQARAWAESTLAHGNYSSPIAPGPPTVTERYFEFAPQRTPGLGNVRMRVHRSSYLTDYLTSAPVVGGTIARFRHWPVTAASVCSLAEYLWYHDSSRYDWPKVLTSTASETRLVATGTMFVLQIVGGDFGVRNQIALVRLDYRVSKPTGEVQLSFRTLREIAGHQH